MLAGLILRIVYVVAWSAFLICFSISFYMTESWVTRLTFLGASAACWLADKFLEVKTNVPE